MRYKMTKAEAGKWAMCEADCVRSMVDWFRGEASYAELLTQLEVAEKYFRHILAVLEIPNG